MTKVEEFLKKGIVFRSGNNFPCIKSPTNGKINASSLKRTLMTRKTPARGNPRSGSGR